MWASFAPYYIIVLILIWDKEGHRTAVKTKDGAIKLFHDWYWYCNLEHLPMPTSTPRLLLSCSMLRAAVAGEVKSNILAKVSIRYWSKISRSNIEKNNWSPYDTTPMPEGST